MDRVGDCSGEFSLGENEKSWCWSLDGSFHHNGSCMTFIDDTHRSTIGVYLDWPAGILSFFEVFPDRLKHLYTVRTTFTEPLHPGFHVGDGSVRICKINWPLISEMSYAQPRWANLKFLPTVHSFLIYFCILFWQATTRLSASFMLECEFHHPNRPANRNKLSDSTAAHSGQMWNKCTLNWIFLIALLISHWMRMNCEGADLRMSVTLRGQLCDRGNSVWVCVYFLVCPIKMVWQHFSVCVFPCGCVCACVCVCVCVIVRPHSKQRQNLFLHKTMAARLNVRDVKCNFPPPTALIIPCGRLYSFVVCFNHRKEWQKLRYPLQNNVVKGEKNWPILNVTFDNFLTETSQQNTTKKEKKKKSEPSL